MSSREKLSSGLTDAWTGVGSLEEEIEHKIAQAVEFAESSEFPPQQELLKYVYK